MMFPAPLADLLAAAVVRLSVLAQTTLPGAAAPTTQGDEPPGLIKMLFGNGSFFLPLMALMVVFYIFAARSKKTQQKQKDSLLNQIKRGDRVQTIGGILGKVVDVEETKVLLKVDENSNTKIWFHRKAIDRVVDEEKGEAAK